MHCKVDIVRHPVHRLLLHYFQQLCRQRPFVARLKRLFRRGGGSWLKIAPVRRCSCAAFETFPTTSIVGAMDGKSCHLEIPATYARLTRRAAACVHWAANRPARSFGTSVCCNTTG